MKQQFKSSNSLLTMVFVLFGKILIAAVPPVADFSANSTMVCTNTTVTFSDLSTETPTGWSWSFSPATITYEAGTSAASQNPQVSFDATGTYDVTLIATNADGSGTETKTAYIDVSGPGVFLISEDFTTGVPPSGWTVENPDSGEGWESTTVTSGTDGNSNKVARMDNYQYNAPGQEDYLIMPAVDLTQLTNPMLYFDVAYAAYGQNNFERLHIEYSTDAGTTYTSTSFDKEHLELATVGYQTSGWGPQQAGHWRAEAVDLSAYSGDNVIFRFTQTAGYGNGLFIDNVRIKSADLPATDFEANTNLACLGEAVMFTDITKNLPTDWTWTFTPNTVTFLNGTNANSQNPQVRFDAAGSYSMSLTTTNANGSGSLSKTDFIKIVADGTLPFSEDFTGGVPPAGWVVLNPDNSEGWETTTTTGADGNSTKVIRMDNYQYNAPGALDEFVLPALDLSGVISAELVFDVAYAPYSSTNFERLHIEYSTDCGATFAATTFDKQHLDLATVGYQTSGWGPQEASHWREERIDISAYAGSTAIFKFIQTAGYGNGLFIDNVRIEGTVLPVELIRFNARPVNSDVLLAWQTAAEVNNSHFDLEHATDGRNFTKIGEVAAVAQPADVNNYDFLHKNPVEGSNYYRLRQVDTDGTHTYSDVRTVLFERDFTVAVYPNPTDGMLYFSAAETIDEVQVYDLAGRLVRTLTPEGQTIDLRDLPAGVYACRVQVGGRVYARRVVKE